MNRNAGTMALCLAIGAAITYGSSNFRLRVEPVSTPEAKTPVVAAPHGEEPGRLPPDVSHSSRQSDSTRRDNRDTNVRPAGFLADSPTPVDSKIVAVTDTIAGQSVRWDVARFREVKMAGSTTGSVTISLAPKPGATDVLDVYVDRVKVDPTTVNVAVGKDQDQLTITLSDKLPATRFQLGIAVRNKDAASGSQRDAIDLIRAGAPPANGNAAVITAKYQNSPFAADLNQFLDVPTTAVEVFGGYLRLKGQVFVGSPQMSFFKVLSQQPFGVDAVVKPINTSSGEWDAELMLGQSTPGTTGYVITRVDGITGHYYASTAFQFDPKPALTPGKPTADADPLPPAKEADPKNPVEPRLFRVNTLELTGVKITPPAGAQKLLLYAGDQMNPSQVESVTGTNLVTFKSTKFPVDGNYIVSVAAATGKEVGPRILFALRVRTAGPTVATIAAPGFGGGLTGKENVTIQFSGEELDPSALNTGNYELKFNDGASGRTVATIDSTPKYSAATNTVQLTYDSKSIVPGSYALTIKTADKDGNGGIRDVFGNVLRGPRGQTKEDPVTAEILAMPGDKALPSQRAGVTLGTGPAVEYPEYVKFRVSPDGFNPSDRVETRVVRLYYFRDAHRVAQIVNRTVKSYNAATVDIRRRAADRGRDEADQATDERKRLEVAAVRAAQDARAAEGELAAVQNRINSARTEAAEARIFRNDRQRLLDQLAAMGNGNTPQAADLRREIARADQVVAAAEGVERAGPSEIARVQANITAKRDAEAKAVEAWQVKELLERRLRERQDRAEVAAAREDPDTYGPGKLESVDPVMQVSISVIGEGLIQLRGPIKGLNVIRTMVNQIDAPVGQVRIAVHTLQVNGERADRMEKVIANIQRYLDHSRFLTAQSGQMLRRAVTSVASRKALEAQSTLAPGATQWDRDQRYLYAFFGKDFTDELAQLDSEFLKTGNKLLSLNSMDSTSLSAALFLLALAKNDVRAEIINEFLALVQRELPQAEWNYYAAGISDLKCCEACKDKKQYLLAYNSKFQSFIGFFTSETQVPDTLTPLQREFIRLAQIFKARMITEMQLKQRVMERALLEERIGTVYLEELKKAKDLEDKAKQALREARDASEAAQAEVAAQFRFLLTSLDAFQKQIEGLPISELIKALEAEVERYKGNPLRANGVTDRTAPLTFFGNAQLNYKLTSGLNPDTMLTEYVFTLTDSEWKTRLKPSVEMIRKLLAEVVFFDDLAKAATRVLSILAKLDQDEVKISLTELRQLEADLKALVRGATLEINVTRQTTNEIILKLQSFDDEATKVAVERYNVVRVDLTKRINPGGDTAKKAAEVFGKIDSTLQTLFRENAKYASAAKKARDARRPLDEKKLLDMLVDEMEDKFIEILEGTRSHTANIDNYMKSIATALDDDFNTQYYLPSFRRAREASRYWDVTLAQIETTSVLTNNRSLGKVNPAATFEFDLPKRDILITEGFKSAKALMDEYGALVNDPSFLALAKIYSGNPVSMMQGGNGGFAAVRNVLPSLATSPDERILAQAGPGRKEFGASLDALIPDPAIYKFETGTGFEIRPVLSPDGQAVVFNFDYTYTTDVREPVRADEKHLGRVKRHFVHTDVQLSNFELREVSKYLVALKVARTGRGVQLLQDIPGVGVLFRPLPSAGSSLQQNLIYSQATIFPTLFDLMGLRYAPAVADIDPLADRNAEFAVRYRRLDLEQRIYDIGATRVDDALRTPYGERRYDLYRPQVSLPYRHPNGYIGPGLRLKDGKLVEDYNVFDAFPPSQFAPNFAPETRPPQYPLGAPYGPPGSEIPPPSHVPGHGGPPGNSPYPPPPLLMPKVPGDPLPTPRPIPSPGGPGQPGIATTPGRPSAPGNSGSPFPSNVPVNVGRPVPYPSTSTTPGVGGVRPQEIPSTNYPPVITPGVPALTPPPSMFPVAPLPPIGR